MSKNTNKSQLDPYDINNPLFLNAIQNLDPKKWKVIRYKKRGMAPKVSPLQLAEIKNDVIKFRDSGLKWKEVKALIMTHHHTNYSITRLFDMYKSATHSK